MEKSPSSKHISENKKAEIRIITEDSSFLIFMGILLGMFSSEKIRGDSVFGCHFGGISPCFSFYP
ncbi:hypothetical protein [Anaerotignum sp.]|uniref:hypothetical protein n=1 Tax=Anaerotignum sp. TaxID=2039241 RepID=UPI0037362027